MKDIKNVRTEISTVKNGFLVSQSASTNVFEPTKGTCHGLKEYLHEGLESKYFETLEEALAWVEEGRVEVERKLDKRIEAIEEARVK